MHQLDNETSADLFLTKACQEVWAQRAAALASGVSLDSREFDASAFCYALTNGRVVFGLPLYELEDSYLIAMPAVLVNDNGVVKGTSMVSEPLIRVFKSNMLFSSACNPKHLAAYYTYLHEKRRLLQGLVSSEGLACIEQAAREHLSVNAFVKAISQDFSDGSEGDSEYGGEEGGVRSTMPLYYNPKTRH